MLTMVAMVFVWRSFMCMYACLYTRIYLYVCVCFVWLRKPTVKWANRSASHARLLLRNYRKKFFLCVCVCVNQILNDEKKELVYHVRCLAKHINTQKRLAQILAHDLISVHIGSQISKQFFHFITSSFIAYII